MHRRIGFGVQPPLTVVQEVHLDLADGNAIFDAPQIDVKPVCAACLGLCLSVCVLTSVAVNSLPIVFQKPLAILTDALLSQGRHDLHGLRKQLP
jgi:hypothetical protein